jgi:hypothetical protein
MNTAGAAETFFAARDFILKHRTDYDTAVRAFHWPARQHFNWALDYFDTIAAGNERPALHIVDGYLTFVGRVDDVFKASDYTLSPFELESVLIEHAAVAEAAVVPSPDPLRHAVPKAFVTPAAGFNPSRELAAEILSHCRNPLAPYKRIRRIEFGALPKTISGKIRRIELRHNEMERAGGWRGPHEFFEEDLQGANGRCHARGDDRAEGPS